MKTSLNVDSIKPLQKCESTFITSGLQSLSVWLQLLGHVRKNLLKNLLLHVIQALKTGRAVLTSYSLGLVLLVMGVGSVFAHQFFFNMSAQPHDVCRLLDMQCYSKVTKAGWCYVSWFYYWETIRFCVAGIFLTLAGFLFVPASKSLAFIPFSLIHGAAWTGLFHYTFSVHSHETYHMFPQWHFIVLGLTLGFGIIISSGHFMYWLHHKKRGNWQRWPAVHRLNIDQQLKNKLFDELTEEYYRVNKTI